MSIGRLHRTDVQRRLQLSSSASFGAQMEQVAGRVVKIQRVAVNNLMLKKSVRIPSRELLVGEIVDLPANLRPDIASR